VSERDIEVSVEPLTAWEKRCHEAEAEAFRLLAHLRKPETQEAIRWALEYVPDMALVHERRIEPRARGGAGEPQCLAARSQARSPQKGETE
jgi:hypothetical protein